MKCTFPELVVFVDFYNKFSSLSPSTLSLSLFSGSEVMLSGYEEEKATVVGIDKYGYLQVLRKSGETVSLQPDGNSFDITKGLIIMKSK